MAEFYLLCSERCGKREQCMNRNKTDYYEIDLLRLAREDAVGEEGF